MTPISVDFCVSDDEAMCIEAPIHVTCSVNASLSGIERSAHGISRLTPDMLLGPTNTRNIAPALDASDLVLTAILRK